jgi:transketolase
LAAAQMLAEKGISARVLNVGTLKPLDRNAVIGFAEGVRAVVTAEEHTIIGGLGSAVLEALCGVPHAPVELIGIHDSFGCSAENYDALLEHFGLTAEAIASAVQQILEGSS